jgi:hypothetical protein
MDNSLTLPFWIGAAIFLGIVIVVFLGVGIAEVFSRRKRSR